VYVLHVNEIVLLDVLKTGSIKTLNVLMLVMCLMRMNILGTILRCVFVRMSILDKMMTNAMNVKKNVRNAIVINSV
jgi:hypothetical protein